MEPQWLITRNLKRHKTKFLVIMAKCLKANINEHGKHFPHFKRNGKEFGYKDYSVPLRLQKSCKSQVRYPLSL